VDRVGAYCGDICDEFSEFGVGGAGDDEDYEGEETSGYVLLFPRVGGR